MALSTISTTAAEANASETQTQQALPSPSPSLLDRLECELRPTYPLYSLQESPFSQRSLDLAACFAPRRRCHATMLVRLLLLAWSFQVLYYDLVMYPKHNLYIYLGYLTHIGLVMAVFYFAFSLLCTIVPRRLLTRTKAPSHNKHTGGCDAGKEVRHVQPSLLTMITWTLYATVAPLQVAITMLYWASGMATATLQPITYVSVMEHGILCILVWIDGLLVGLVPVRAKQVWFLVITAVAYLAWTILDAVLDIGNGEWGPAWNDDALYPVLNWKTETQSSAILSAFVVVVLAPAIFYTCWVASLVSLSTPKHIGGGVTPSLAQHETSSSWRHSCRCCYCCCCKAYLVCDGSRRPLIPDANECQGFDYKQLTREGVMA